MLFRSGLHCHVTADHGAFDACADPTKFPAGFFHICTGSYDIPVAYVGVDGVYTNKAPGGVAYRCSFRVTEAAYFIERMIEVLAIELGMDAAELRAKNFIRKEQFPYHSALGWEYDSGDYHTAWDKALKAVDYAGLRREQAERVEAFKRGETRKLMLRSEEDHMIDASYDLRNVSWSAAVADAFAVLLQPTDRVIGVIDKPPNMSGDMIEVALFEAPLRHAMIGYGINILILSVILSVIVAGLVFAALNIVLVRPIKQLTSVRLPPIRRPLARPGARRPSASSCGASTSPARGRCASSTPTCPSPTSTAARTPVPA